MRGRRLIRWKICLSHDRFQILRLPIEYLPCLFLNSSIVKFGYICGWCHRLVPSLSVILRWWANIVDEWVSLRPLVTRNCNVSELVQAERRQFCLLQTGRWVGRFRQGIHLLMLQINGSICWFGVWVTIAFQYILRSMCLTRVLRGQAAIRQTLLLLTAVVSRSLLAGRAPEHFWRKSCAHIQSGPTATGAHAGWQLLHALRTAAITRSRRVLVRKQTLASLYETWRLLHSQIETLNGRTWRIDWLLLCF